MELFSFFFLFFLIIYFSFFIFIIDASPPAMYVFGDSFVDAGNPGFHKVLCNFPYGIDFKFPISFNGRCTNGFTMADYYAIFLGLPLVPSYMALTKEERGKVINGINYASAGCGILPHSQTMPGCLNLDKQITNFEKTILEDLPKSIPNPIELKLHIAKSIFYIYIGTNDFAYFLTNYSVVMTPQYFSHFLLGQFTKRLKILYDLGARKFVVNNLLPLGCIPANRIHGQCNDKINKNVFKFTKNLPLMLQNGGFNGAVFATTPDYFKLFENPLIVKQSGIKDMIHGCRKFGSKRYCKDRDNYFFFDDVHTTEAANHVLALGCFNGSLCQPWTLQHIAELS